MQLHLKKTLIQPGLPFWQLAELFADQPCGALLDSGMDSQKLGHFSFLAGRPTALLKAKRQPRQGNSQREFLMDLTRWQSPSGIREDEPSSTQWPGNPFAALRDLQQEYGMIQDGVSDIPFSGGLIGYLGYELGQAIEVLPDQGLDDLDLPDLAFMVVDEVFVHDHTDEATHLLVTGRGSDDESAKLDAELRTRELLELLSASTPSLKTGKPQPEPVTGSKIRAHFTRETYMQAVDRCREHILAGDLFEICLTQRLETDLTCDPWELYQRLREINPAPFASWLHFGDFQVVSASPERFLRLDRHRLAESRPIKGTRPRGDNPWDDQRLRDELQTCEKDRAENVMIVDLVRNDIGKVAEIGSVEVPELLAVEPYATVFQLVSTITGRLRPECDAFDLVKSCFPGGSMTGAPKIEAMKTIDTIEPVKRGIYSGAIGYFDRGGALDLSIVIRTIVCKDGKATFGVGGAIVTDSDPAAEYQETLDKASALMRALGAKF